MASRSAQQWQAWGTSCTLHLVLLLCLAAIVVQKRVNEAPSSIETRIVDLSPASEPFLPALDMPGQLNDGGSPAAGPAMDQLLATAPSGAGIDMTAAIGPLSGAGGVGLGGDGDGSGIMGAEQGIGFFGTRGSGKSVVFVVDMSGSMEGIRFVRAQQELVRAIHRLHVTQKFYVIFFNQHAVPMFSPRPPKELVAATPTMKRSVTRWIVERRPGTGTEPEESLLMALALKPEVIYFLTDGEFPERCREVCKEKNTHGTVIHTIALQSREGVSLLEAIAHDHKGTFKLVK